MSTPPPVLRDPNWNSGILAWFAQNRVAANLLMVLVLGGGLMSMLQMRQEVFPELDTGLITVQVPYPGASPDEVEEGVILRVEEAVEGVDGIDRIRSVAAEGQGTVTVELEDYANQQKALNDIESAVNRIDTFPQEIERPVISEITNRVQVLSFVLAGDVPERTLKELAERMRNELTARGGVSQVDISGVRRYEISIEVSEEAQRRYELTFQEISEVVRRSSLDLPAGSIETRGGEILLRTKGQRYRGRQFEDLIVRTTPEGTVVRLRDVARVIDGFEESDVASYFDGSPAVVLKAFAVGEEDSLEVAAAVKQYVEDQQPKLPAGVTASIWFDRSRYLEERIDLLVRNAWLGLILVFLCLTAFLTPKLAFWTTMGIPISFMGAFWLLPQLDVTINMISLFAFIVVLGIVVDDAIVVGENIFAYRQQGMDPVEAAVRGVREMAGPVTSAVLTSVAAFLPLLFTAGEIGRIIRHIPIVVIMVLMVSLVEAFLILPAHLNTGKSQGRQSRFSRIQSRIHGGLEQVIQGPYQRALEWSMRWRYATAALALALFLVIVGFVAGGHIKFVFFEDIDSDNVLAELTMPQGTPVEQTRAVVAQIEAAAGRVREQLDTRSAEEAPSVIRHVSTTIGQQPFKQLVAGPAAAQGAAGPGTSHLAEVNLELVSSEFRNTPAAEIANLWRHEVGRIPGVSSLVFQSTFFSVGEDINVEISHSDFNLTLQAAEELKGILSKYQGVSDIEDSFLPGKPEIRLSLKEEARTVGLTLDDLARQVRHAFYGAEAQRIQRGREDVKVMVRYPEAERQNLLDVQRMRIRLPDGTEVPFEVVAQMEIGRGYAQIDRADRRRIVRVTAAVDENLPGVSAGEINAELAAQVLPQLREQFPGIVFGFEGQQAERTESMKSLGINFLSALMLIFALLGVQFRSYIQPVIVMSAIPFGLIGAVIGHIIMGLNLSFLSFFGIVALTGVVVNDSLIMIDHINSRRAGEGNLEEVVRTSGMRRFRPVLLTTLTTFLGLTPMLLERSLQARFLIPMAVSLAFGVLFATAITLLLVPTLYLILEDIRAWVTRSLAGLHRAATMTESPNGRRAL